MAKKMIRLIRTEPEYDEILEAIERYFENEPKPGTPESDGFGVLPCCICGCPRRRRRSTGWRGGSGKADTTFPRM